jgi:hypothetical protein
MQKAPNTYRMLLFKQPQQVANFLYGWDAVRQLLRTILPCTPPAAARTPCFPSFALHGFPLSLHVCKKKIRS